MARGRKRKLKAIDILEGNPSNREIEDYGIKGLGEPFIPEHLMDDARGCIECIKASMPPQVYSALDSYALAAFGMAWAIHKRAAHEINNPTFEFVKGNSEGLGYPNAWLTILNKQAQMMVAIGSRLGLDPVARQALKLPKARQQSSKFDGLTGQTGSSVTLNA